MTDARTSTHHTHRAISLAIMQATVSDGNEVRPFVMKDDGVVQLGEIPSGLDVDGASLPVADRHCGRVVAGSATLITARISGLFPIGGGTITQIVR
jgi:hypothetical protein